MANDLDWIPPHSHEPNPAPPTAESSFVLATNAIVTPITPDDLLALPQLRVAGCYIVSTGHGTSGPFTFGGASLFGLVELYAGNQWTAVEVAGADGFRTRITFKELREATARPILLALAIDGRPLSRAEGLVRLIVPGEVGDALRQVKWVGEIHVIE